MREATIKVYKFDELSEAVQNKLIKKYKNEYEFDELEELMYDKLHTLISDEVAENLEMQYSLSSCQGDGVSLTGEFNRGDCWDLLQEVYKGIIPHDVERLLNKEVIYSINIVRDNNRYCHKYTCSVEVTDNYNAVLEEYPHIAKTFMRIERDVTNWYYNLCAELESFGYDYIYSVYDDKCIREVLSDSEIEYFEDGRELY